MTAAERAGEAGKGRAVIVELVGPAGAGKSTLAQGVHATDATVRVGLGLWGLPTARLLESAIALIPTIVASAFGRVRLRWGEIMQMIRLGALRRVVRQEARQHRIILLDEGPVFALSWLDLFFARNGDRAPASWRRRTVAEWAALLDVVVFLDAADLTLAQRIRERDKPHRVKDSPDAEIFGFSAAFRNAFDKVIVELSRAGHLVVDAMRTDHDPVAHNAARLLTTLKKRRNGH